MNLSGTTRLVGFFANPAKHSISPAMHNAAFKERNLDACYLAFEIEKNQLPESIQALRVLNMLGANISMPFKTEVVNYMDDLSPSAKLIGAVNTVINRDGKLIGDNTDGKGFMASLKELHVEVIGKTMTLLGGGGAAVAIIAQAALDGVETIFVGIRNPEEKKVFTEKIAEIHAQTNCEIEVFDLADEAKLQAAIEQSVLLVNATSVGMAKQKKISPVPDTIKFPPELFVYDIIYNPRTTKFLKMAEAQGVKTSNGLPMLLYQGAIAFELWTEAEFPLEKIRPIVENS